MPDMPSYSTLFRILFSRCRCDLASPQSTLWRSSRNVYTSGNYTRSKPILHQSAHLQPITRSALAKEPPLRHVGSYSQQRRKQKQKEIESPVPWKPRVDAFPPARLAEFDKYEMVTADSLRSKHRRPKRVKMLMRDFIEDSLYNPGYGYFASQAVIFNAGEAFDFSAMKSEAAFMRKLAERYSAFEDSLDQKEPNDTRQLWHTPTELFRPHYAEAMARYMVSNYKMANYPYHDLIIYEMGAGNGTFMLNVLDYIRHAEPEVYARTRYRIIEISRNLAGIQNNALMASAAAHDHADRVEIINQSIFTWDTYISSPCFFLALEVIDNFAHDVIRYNPRTEVPVQGNVLIDTDGDFFQVFSPELDPVASRYLRVRAAACDGEIPFIHPLRWSRWKRTARSHLPFAPKLSEPEWIPTRCMQFFDVLQKYFPGHRLLLSDFTNLSEAVAGLNGPVVQTRYERKTVPVSTPLVHQGYFDIMFPTDFAVLEGIYRAITGRFTRVLSHDEFLRRWAYVDATQCVNGDNPMLNWYRNAAFMVTI